MKRHKPFPDPDKPRKPIPRQSAKRAAEKPQRDAVRAQALRAAGHRCQLADVIPEVRCWGPLDVDEVAARGVAPGGHLDEDNVQVACRAHHDWRHNHPTAAYDRGIRLTGGEYKQMQDERLRQA